MPQTPPSKEEIARQAEELYRREIRYKLEEDEGNIEKIIVIDLESGDY